MISRGLRSTSHGHVESGSGSRETCVSDLPVLGPEARYETFRRCGAAALQAAVPVGMNGSAIQ